MGNWGDDQDYEVADLEKRKLDYGILISFKSMLNALNRISEETGEHNENYPRNCLDNIWIGDMLMLSIFILLTYNIVAIATLPFILAYGYVLIRLSSTYKQFGYSTSKLWIKTIITLIIVTALTTALKIFILS